MIPFKVGKMPDNFFHFFSTGNEQIIKIILSVKDIGVWKG